MSQISDTEGALLGLLRTCQLPAGVHIASAPHSWDSGFVQRLLTTTPAVLLAFLGAVPKADAASSTSLNLTANWGCYAVIGWNGKSQEQRRLAVDGGYDIVTRVAPILHNAIIEDPARQRLPIPAVTAIDVLTDSALDLANLWICEVLVEVELPLEIPFDCVGPLDDWLEARATFDLEGGKPLPDIADAGVEGDVPMQTDLPQ